MTFSLTRFEMGGCGQAFGEELLLVGEFIPGFQSKRTAFRAMIVSSRTFHGVFAFKPFQFSILCSFYRRFHFRCSTIHCRSWEWPDSHIQKT
jgi:hypothetical protein